MSREIWKFKVNPLTSPIKMPIASTILSCGTQKETIYDTEQGTLVLEHIFVWASVNPDECQLVERTIYVIATGQEVPDDVFFTMTFLGTVQFKTGPLVFHLFFPSREQA